MSVPKSMDDILQHIEYLPAMPKAVLEIIRCIDDPDTGVDEVVRTISLDIGLTASILKVANAARYSGHGNITNINDALMVVGLQQIRTMVCIVGVKDSFPQIKSPFFNYTNFWRHSVSVAVCARTLAKLAGTSPAVGFIAGMLHDIGQLIFTMAVPEDFNSAMEYRASHKCQDFEAEQAVLGMDHSAIGAHLAKKWKLPPVICNAIENHHSPDVPPTLIMADLIHVSEVLSHALEMGYAGHSVPPISDRALSRLGISFTKLKPSLAQIECEYQNAILMLN